VALYRLYGLVVQADTSLPAPPAHGSPDISITTQPLRFRSTIAPNIYGYSYQRRTDGSVHVSWSDLFDFVVHANGRRIDVFAGTDIDGETVVAYLISQVLSVALLLQGIPTLHASAVSLHGNAVVLLGESGFGKSTLTAALLAEGAQLITDDLLVLRKEAAGYVAVPGAQRIKLAPAAADALHLAWPDTPMLDDSGKHVYHVPAAHCAAAPVPVERVLLLQPDAAQPSLVSLSKQQATRALLSATFNPLHTENARLQELLLTAEAIADALPFYQLAIPRALARLAEVSALVPPR
jgi:hypothetical protein